MLALSMALNGVAGLSPCLVVHSFRTHGLRLVAELLRQLQGPYRSLGSAIGFVIGPIFAVNNHSLRTLYFFEAIIALVLFAVILLAFPERPLVPPSRSTEQSPTVRARSALHRQMSPLKLGLSVAMEAGLAGTHRADAATGEDCRAMTDGRGAITSGIVDCVGDNAAVESRLRSKRLWLIGIAAALPTGIAWGWSSVLFPSLKPFGESELDAGTLGWWMTLSGSIVGLIVASVTDAFRSHRLMKEIATVLYAMGAASLICFVLLAREMRAGVGHGQGPHVEKGDIRATLRQLCTAALVGRCCITAATPLLYELALEVAHPVVPKAAASALLTLLTGAAQIAFTGIVQEDDGSATAPERWLWLLAIATPAAMVCLALVEVDFARTRADD